MQSDLTRNQLATERQVRAANLTVGHTPSRREVHDGNVVLRYGDGAVCTIRRDGGYEWSGTVR